MAQIQGECVEQSLTGQPIQNEVLIHIWQCKQACSELTGLRCVQATRSDGAAEFTLSRALAQDSREGIYAHGSWHYARVMAMSTVTDRRTTGMVLKEKQQRGSSLRQIVVHRLRDNEDGSKGAAEKAGKHRDRFLSAFLRCMC